MASSHLDRIERALFDARGADMRRREDELGRDRALRISREVYFHEVIARSAQAHACRCATVFEHASGKAMVDLEGFEPSTS
jgi:hypothetical protein